ELRKDGCVTCDRVALDGDVTGAKGSLARIVTIDERSSVLTRAAEDGEEVEQTIVANADQLVIVMAAANPEPRPRLVDRYLVAAYNAGLKPILVVTKCDVSDPADFIAGFAGVELEIIQTRSDQPLPERLLEALVDHTSVFVGHSGVGKSTLINKLAPNTDRSTGIVNELTGKGKHTSSSAIAIKVSGGWIVDTPGIRSFGLSGISAGQILRGFSDLSEAAEACPRDCSHMPPADDCALDQALREGKLTELRLDSFRRLVAGLGSVDWQ
ncbi:MAG: ribosome small subunit-dependent GTPase A, partial [Actinobacteria bacterium]|nr:ribosome small subunit-dependent GTPase A [Actinomycetota bacterium]